MIFSDVKNIVLPEGEVIEIRLGEALLWKKEVEEANPNIWYDFGTISGSSDSNVVLPAEIPALVIGQNYIVYIDDTPYEVTAEMGFTARYVALSGDNFYFDYSTSYHEISYMLYIDGEHSVRIEYATVQ